MAGGLGAGRVVWDGNKVFSVGIRVKVTVTEKGKECTVREDVEAEYL